MPDALDKINHEEIQAAIATAAYDKDYEVVFHTEKGDINLEVYATKTPKTAKNFEELIKAGYYDGLNFHRVIPDFMIQGGCPLGRGNGGPGYQFEDEFHPDLKHDAGGILSMANAGKNTNGSQFFITHTATPWLDGNHTVFGKIKGEKDMETVNDIRGGDKILSAEIK